MRVLLYDEDPDEDHVKFLEAELVSVGEDDAVVRIIETGLTIPRPKQDVVEDTEQNRVRAKMVTELCNERIHLADLQRYHIGSMTRPKETT